MRKLIKTDSYQICKMKELHRHILEENKIIYYSIPNDGRIVTGKCFKPFGDDSTESWYPNKHHILFLLYEHEAIEPLVICTYLEILESSIFRPTNLCIWHIEDKSINLYTKYIQFTYLNKGKIVNGYISERQILKVLQLVKSTDATRIFTLKFLHTISHAETEVNLYNPSISTNHYQSKINIHVFNIEEINDNITQYMEEQDNPARTWGH